MHTQPLGKTENWISEHIIDSAIEKRGAFSTELGILFEGDCLKLLPFVCDEAIDTVFADPPFNLSKEYGSKVNDNRTDEDYISWCKEWLDHCIRVLKPGRCYFRL